MEDMFSRTINLIGLQNFNKLHSAKVALFGVGGVGGYIAEALARIGIGEILLVDADVVSKSNINRQIIALHSTIGQAKVEVAKSRILDINPALKVNVVKKFATADNISEFNLEEYDYIIDAIDTVSAKIALICSAKKLGVKIISCMGTGNKLHPESFEIADISKTSQCPLAKVMRKELKDRNISNVKVLFSKEKPQKPQVLQAEAGRHIPASISTVPAVAGLLIANEVILDIMEDK